MKDNRERLFTILIVSALIFSLFTVFVYSEHNPSLKFSARSAALYDTKNNQFIFTKNENARLSMASTTKIMTAMVVIDNADLDKTVVVDDRAVGIEGSSIYLRSGEEITVKALLYALMLRSANDAAEALAYDICGSIEAFAELMNEKANDLGLADTNFKNPHGLDAENHYTTAHDLAIISAEALKNPTFKDIASTRKIEIESSIESRILVNHNKLLSLYDGCIGIKTGYTKKSGRSLVSAAQKGESILVCVTIDAPDDWNDHKKLLDYGFSRINATEPISRGDN